MNRDRPLSGNANLGRLAAPDIRPEGLAARGWDVGRLREYLRTGLAEPAAASGEMLTVVRLSTSQLSDTDVDAMLSYLRGDQPPETAAAPVAIARTDSDESARGHYLALCAGCHGSEGEGVSHVAVALQGNSTLRDPDPHNLVVAILDGLPEHDFPGLARMQDMPGFAHELNDADVAALATYLRSRHGGQAVAVDAATVSRLHDATRGL